MFEAIHLLKYSLFPSTGQYQPRSYSKSMFFAVNNLISVRETFILMKKSYLQKLSLANIKSYITLMIKVLY